MAKSKVTLTEKSQLGPMKVVPNGFNVGVQGEIPLHPIKKVFEHLGGWYNDILSKFQVSYWTDSDMVVSGTDFKLFVKITNIYSGYGDFDNIKVIFNANSICELLAGCPSNFSFSKLNDGRSIWPIEFKLHAQHSHSNDRSIGSLEIFANFEGIPIVHLTKPLDISVWEIYRSPS